ncbi:MAG: polysaccharide biosynthesis protein [Clostridiales Family XIII bacterium]|jgi:stage V sporulation protein B|nr:polysaccharide biosynthesis protein [Clostridiales Family XIII bacterium]
MDRKTFMQGAVILAAAGVVIKALGAVFRIPLGNMISDTGMGYYQTAYTIYVMFLVLSNSGIPVAISRMVSERIAVGRPDEAHRVFRVSFILLFVIGIATSCFCFFRTGFILQFFPNMENSSYAIKAIAPALLIVPLMAAYRGYFQGRQDMRPTAKSQIAEQFFRVAAGLTVAYLLLPQGGQMAAAGAAFGATAGAIAGLVTIMAIYAFDKKKTAAGPEEADPADSKLAEAGPAGAEKEPVHAILLKIFIIAVPITIGAAIMPIMNFIDLAIISNRLATLGWMATDVREAYGQLAGFANPLINLPQILTQAVAMSLVPAVAAAYKKKDMAFLRHNIQLGLRTAVIIGLPCALGMMTLSEQIMALLFPMARGAAQGAAPFLFILAFGIIFLSTVQTLTGVLQGVGRQMIPVCNLFIGAAAKIAVTWCLIAVPSVNVKGAAIGTVTAYIIAAALNLLAVRRHTGTRFDVRLTYVKPLFAALVMSFVVWAGYKLLFLFLVGVPAGHAISTVIAVCAGVAAYGILLLAGGAVTAEELKLLPKGEKIAKMLARSYNYVGRR